MALFPPRSAGRQPLHSPFWAKRWVSFVMPTAMVGIILQLLFLGNMSYLYGVLFKSSSRTHALKVVAVDYDGGDIGQALSVAYSSLKGNTFPTVEFHSVSDYPTPKHLQEAVCKEDYWGAIYTHPGASDRLINGIQGKNTTAYDPKSTISYAYVGSYYPVIAASLIEANMQTLISVASRTYYQVSTKSFSAVNLSDPVSSSVFLNPIQASSEIEMPSNQGGRVLLNTVSTVMPVLMQFFFLMAMNGIFNGAQVLSKLSKRDTYFTRLFFSKVYTFLCAVGMTGYIWAFREGWSVTGGKFAETLMCLWLSMEINYVVVDTILEVVIPLKFFPFFLLTWIIINVASTIYPFPLSAGFYRWGYFLPAHNIWTLLMEIWSSGCKMHNEVALPVLLAWWTIGHLTSAWAVRKRCLATESAPIGNGLKTDSSLTLRVVENA